ncbi:DUF4286 family protein [Chlorogloeopsis fritschii PCC 9212]|uniref:EthD domain-containing protein n=1 Tax=Chlorogloeopsis fritschii PCC 6912 TaxID=211165 RepID=A0A433NNK7_CHLFR|nr:DUF4286 family protein [Chlorogloeopsis fritschii]RUR84935.1 hypothetical protein PCC6912_10510 [Chlorogloeopsis fritschii PCC 6912]
MVGKPLMTVSLRVDPEAEAGFNEFYHHVYIPRLLEVIPELISARRYEEYGVEGSLKWFTKQFLTIYEFGSEALIDTGIKALNRAGREAEKETWKRWGTNHLHDVRNITYRETYAHERVSWDGAFGSRILFIVTVEVKPEQEPEFRRWYEEEYLSKIMADVPTWAACRRYTSVNAVPTRYLTIYEAASQTELERSFALMRSPHRFGSNADWNSWVGRAITYQDASSFRPIFRRPG